MRLLCLVSETTGSSHNAQGLGHKALKMRIGSYTDHRVVFIGAGLNRHHRGEQGANKMVEMAITARKPYLKGRKLCEEIRVRLKSLCFSYGYSLSCAVL